MFSANSVNSVVRMSAFSVTSAHSYRRDDRPDEGRVVKCAGFAHFIAVLKFPDCGDFAAPALSVLAGRDKSPLFGRLFAISVLKFAAMAP